MKKHLLLFAALVSSAALYAQNTGDPDLTFGTNGKTLADGHYTGVSSGKTLKILPDGDILVGGAAYGGLSVGIGFTRFQPDGSLELTWGEKGCAVFLDQNGFGDMEILPDGKVLVTGEYAYGVNLRRFLADGTADVAFGDNGRIEHNDGKFTHIADMAIQTDGKIVLGGYVETNFDNFDFLFVRLLADGSLDPSFGTNGRIVADVYPFEVIHALAVQDDGRIVGVGESHTPGGTSKIALLRYLPDGSPDTTFHVNGIILDSFNIEDNAAYCLLPQPDGRYLVGGNSVPTAFLARFEANGSLDSTFGVNGWTPVFPGEDKTITKVISRADGSIFVFSRQGQGWSVAKLDAQGAPDETFADNGIYQSEPYEIYITEDIALQDSSNLLVLNASYSDFVLRRFTPEGTFDTTFSSCGIDFIPEYPNGDDLFDQFLVQPDGKIVGKRFFGGKEILVRFLPDGLLDASFGVNGWADLLPPGASEIYGVNMALQADGKILVTGIVSQLTGEALFVARFLSNGQIDNSFGTNGLFVEDDGGNAVPVNIAVQADGKILVTGYWSPGFSVPVRVLLLRISDDGAPDNSFGVNGRVVMPVGDYSAYPFDSGLLPDGRILVAGNTQDADYNDVLFIARFQPGGAIDDSFGDQGIVTTNFEPFNTSLFDMKIRPDGRILIAGEIGWYNDTAYYDGYLLVQYNTAGEPDTTFGDNGIARGSNTSYNQFVYSVDLQPDGKILAAGAQEALSGPDVSAVWTVWRFAANGKPDSTWGGNGQIITEIGYRPNAATTMIWLPEGKILAGGFTTNGQDIDIALARYWPGAISSAKETAQRTLALRVQSPAVEQSIVRYELIEAGKVSLFISDPNGRIITSILEQEFQPAGKQQIEIPVKELPAGWYILTLKTGNGAAVSQILIKQ
ncbi:MAG: T9SS C-terminal target domain-containing protein [Haliscomenobacteraceae bacterium CHB4]|nr:hypothetical protein [Saprospiraceae bacterium]MCE7926550.1 T9SS C-terminal target domain-containing protein [Haliscomenobacteraceae bacterium CHB4]